MAPVGEQGQAKPSPRDWWAGYQARDSKGLLFLEPRRKAKHKEKCSYYFTAWAFSYEWEGVMPMVKCGWSHNRAPSSGPNWSHSLEQGWAEKSMGSAGQGPAQHLEGRAATGFNLPWECLHAGSQHRLTSNPLSPQIASTFLQFGVYWFFSEGPLLELFNCHHCKGRQVIFSAEPLLLKSALKLQSSPVL